MDFPGVINANKVTLRKLRLEYAEDVAAAVKASLTDLARFMPWASEGYNVHAARVFIETATDGWRAGSQWNYAIFDTHGTLVGSCGVHDRLGPGSLEIGYWLHSEHTGRGYATMATAALTRAALDQPAVRRVVIKHDAANPASGAVAERAGFREVERRDHEITAPGEVGVQVTWEYP